MSSHAIVVIRSKRTLRYEVKYVRHSKTGPLHRTVEYDSPAEAAAAAIDIQRRLFTPATRIIAPPEVSTYI